MTLSDKNYLLLDQLMQAWLADLSAALINIEQFLRTDVESFICTKLLTDPYVLRVFVACPSKEPLMLIDKINLAWQYLFMGHTDAS